jgi:hypothetical protein
MLSPSLEGPQMNNRDLEALEDQYALRGFDDSEEILRGLEEPKYRRRRRAGAVSGGAGVIVTSPSTLTATDAAPIGFVVGTAAVFGGSGTYTFTLTDPTGRFTFVGNQIQTVSPLTAGFYNITINATNGAGDNPSLATTIFVSHVGVYVPTYYIYGF